MNLNKLRVIKTARNKEAINQAAREGFWPLVKPVKPSPDIKRKFAVLQDPNSGEVQVVNDFRATSGDMTTAIDFTFYYPHHFGAPYAAYLIPKDLQMGERVFIEDLIEDIVGSTWSQGDTYRLESCEAIWDGNDFQVQFEKSRLPIVVG